MDLREIRIKKGMTQRELGLMLGISQQYISKLENGSIDGLTLGTLHKLSRVLNIEEGDLIIILRKKGTLNKY